MAIYCSNRMLHPRPYRIWGRIFYWHHKPMCRRCYRHYCGNIRVIRPQPKPQPVRRTSMVRRDTFTQFLRRTWGW